MSIPFVLIITIAFILSVVLFVYYLIYTITINNRIRKGGEAGRSLVSIPKAVTIFLVGILLVVCIILAVGLRKANADSRQTSRNHFIEGIGEYTQMYSIESNPGYEKEERVDGDFKFTIFRTTDDVDMFHPDFLCYVQYIGKDADNLALYYKGAFVQQKAEGEIELFAQGAGGGNMKDTMLFIGNKDGNCQFELTFSLLDDSAEQKYREADQKAYEEDKGKFPDATDFATVSSRAIID